MQLNKIYYGVIGAGHIGNYHAQQVQKITGVILEGIYDLVLENAQEISEKNNTQTYQDLSSLLDRCHAVTIATPAHSHYQIAMQALHHNCHVFIEKPITTNIKDAQKIADNMNLEIGDSLILLAVEDFLSGQRYFKAHHTIVSNIFATGFDYYDKSFCFLRFNSWSNSFIFATSSSSCFLNCSIISF